MAEEMTETTTEETSPETSTETTGDMPEYLSDPRYAELLTDESSKNILSFYKSEPELAKALVEKEKTIRSGFRLPKKLSAEQIEELRPHINGIVGVPEKPEEYDMIRPEEIPEDMDFSEQFKMELRAYAKEAGIGKATFQGIYERSLHALARSAAEQESTRAEAIETQRKETVALMQKYWGPHEYQRLNGDPNDKNSTGLIDQFVKSRAADQSEYDTLLTAMESSGLSSNPLLFKVLGDAARFYEIMEGRANPNPPEFAATTGAQRQSAEAQNAARYPNTPKSLGGGAPG